MKMIQVKVFRVCSSLKNRFAQEQIQSELERKLNQFIHSDVLKIRKIMQTESVSEDTACVTVTMFYLPKE